MLRRARLAAVVACLIAARGAAAVPVTTVITHGFTVGSKGAWVQGMAEAILDRAGEGSIWRYDPETGAWNFIASLGYPDDVVILIFNWTDESDSVSPGPNWGYVQAASDALYAALREPRYGGGSGPADVLDGRVVHLLGHSRGACVMGEASRRLVLAGIPVDQVTTMDPHPVNGTLDVPLNFNWGDPVPQKWAGITWADNYWRADGGFLNAADFDGISLQDFTNLQLSENALECNENPGTLCMGQTDTECGYAQSHSDTHLWLHGTLDTGPNPDDGEECISDLMRSTWWPAGYTDQGYYFSVLGGGSADRAAQPAGVAPAAVPILPNGQFDQGSYAGWKYHGGGGSGTVVAAGADRYLELAALPGADDDFRHNRSWLPAGACSIVYDYRVTAASGAGDELRVVMRDAAGTIDVTVESVVISSTTGWNTDHVAALPPGVPRQRVYLPAFELSAAGALGAVVDIDNVRFDTDQAACACPWDCGDGNGVVSTADFLALLSQWGQVGTACDFDGGGVTTADFLDLLSHWGPCE